LPDQEYVLPLDADQRNAISALLDIVSGEMLQIAHDIVCDEDHDHNRMDGYAMMTSAAAAVRSLSVVGPHLVAHAIFDGSIPSEVKDEFFPGEFVMLPDGTPAFIGE